MDEVLAESRHHRVRVREIFERGKDSKKIYETLKSVSCQKCHDQNEQRIKSLTKNLCNKFRQRWNQACRIKQKFLEKNRLWLDNLITLPCCLSRGGRLKENFETLSYSGKYKRTEHLRQFETPELLFASKMGLRSVGKSKAAKRLQNVETNPVVTNEIKRISDDRALATIVDARMSKRAYQVIRETAKENHTDIYPPYNNVREAKKRCCPQNIIATDHCVVVNLQSLLDHTTSRLLTTLKLETFKMKNKRLVLLSKWGMDGSSGQAKYKQAFQDDNFSDSNLLLTCVVPLQLYTLNDKQQKVVIWNNPKPSSTTLCRPLKMQFLKENIEISKRETRLVNEEIQSLSETKFATPSQDFFIKHDLYMTMLDMKMINSLTDTSSQKCYLCGASPIEMNKLEKLLEKPIVEDYLQYGITSLHAWIRSFECLLKVSYRLPIEKWQARGQEAQLVIKHQKQKMQTEFKKQLAIIVDQSKQGDGNSNDGNSARIFFRNYKISAKITGINESLIYRFYVILQVLVSGFSIKLQEFEIYTLHTARLFISLYPWYRMPVTIHKILVHGAAIVNASPLPIGQLSEEAQEARNKEYRRYREHNSRKCNRRSTNVDVFNNLCVSSDPVITSLRKKTETKKKSFTPEAVDLLESCSPNGSLNYFSSDSESD